MHKELKSDYNILKNSKNSKEFYNRTSIRKAFSPDKIIMNELNDVNLSYIRCDEVRHWGSESPILRTRMKSLCEYVGLDFYTIGSISAARLNASVSIHEDEFFARQYAFTRNCKLLVSRLDITDDFRSRLSVTQLLHHKGYVNLSLGDVVTFNPKENHGLINSGKILEFFVFWEVTKAEQTRLKRIEAEIGEDLN